MPAETPADKRRDPGWARAFRGKNATVQDLQNFLNEHGALVLKHARTHVRVHGEKIAAEDVAREMELILRQLAERKGVTASSIESADSYLRAIVLHAARRAKRRHTLIQQIAAGDDLQAISDDLGALDADLPEPPAPRTAESIAARKILDELKGKLAPRDALVFALVIEDDTSIEDASRVIAMPPSEVAAARDRILRAAEAMKIDGEAERRHT